MVESLECRDVPATWTVNIGLGQITGDDANALTVNGVPFTTGLTDSSTVLEFRMRGDLVLPPSTIVTFTNNPSNLAVRFFAGNDVVIGAGSIINASGSLSIAGPGGGKGGNAGINSGFNNAFGLGGAADKGGLGGAGGSMGFGGGFNLTTPQPGTDGGTGGEGGFINWIFNGSAGTSGTKGGDSGAGGAGVNNPGSGGAGVSGGLGGKAGAAPDKGFEIGGGGSGEPGGKGGVNISDTGGGGGPGLGALGNQFKGSNGFDAGHGGPGLDGSAGNIGKQSASAALVLMGGGGGSGGSAGGTGGSGGGGSGGAGGAGGGGGGGGGGGAAGSFGTGGNGGAGGKGGNGGDGGKGGDGGFGGRGGNGGAGGGGGGAVEIRALGRIVIAGGINAQGGNGSAGAAGFTNGIGSAGAAGGAGNPGEAGGNGQNGTLGTPGGQGGTGGGTIPNDLGTGGDGKFGLNVLFGGGSGGGGGGGAAGGAGGNGGRGGDGGFGGDGKAGGGGAGGTVIINSSAVDASGLAVNVSAGTGGSPGGGRFILASNSGKAASTVSGALVSVNTIGTGIRSANVHVSGNPQVPNIPSLLSGSTKVGEAYGRTSLTANDFSLAPTGNQGLAVVLLPIGPGIYSDAFAGFSYLFFINASSKLGSSFALDAPRLSIGTGATVPLQNGGWLSNVTFGGAGNTVISSLAPGQVYATLVPNGQSNFNVSATRDSVVTTRQLNGGAALTPGTVYYVDTAITETPSLVVDTTADVVNNKDFQTSLREAIAFAATKAGPDTITFSTLFNSLNTITLAGGQFFIDDATGALTIQGPGANRLTINADQKSRVAEITTGTAVTLNGLTITGGNSGPGNAGGGVLNFGTLTINESAITANTSGSFGGGIASSGSLTISRSTISGNTGSTNGGIDVYNGSLFVMENSTVAGNSATNGAGGVYSNIAATLTNITISGNIGNGAGGLISLATANLTNAIIAGNTGVNADVSGSVLANTSLIGNSTGSTLVGGSFGNLLNVAPLLGLLGDYGGPTRTIPLLPGSPAINVGLPTILSDQRGKSRVGFFDIGAFESQGFQFTPGGSGQSAEVNKTFANPIAVTVAPLNVGEPVDGGMVTFTPPGSGASAILSAGTATVLAGVANVTATANGIAGIYDVVAATAGANSASITLTNSAASEPPSLVVNLTTDVVNNTDNKTSLREAIAFANSKGGADTVTFDPTVFAAGQTITLTGGELSITDAVTITGPTARVTINANKTSRVINTSSSANGSAVTLSRLIITGGQTTGSGGGIFVGEEALTLVDCIVTGNSATVVGGGIHVQSTGAGTPAALILRNTSITGNSGQRGGGFYLFDGGSVLVEASTVSGNSALTQGGGFYFYGQVAAGGLIVRNSTIANNTAGDAGGGIILRGSTSSGTLTVQNSTITGNSAANKGGGIYRLNNAMVIALESSIVSGNIDAAAPDIFSAGTVTMKTSAVGSSAGFTMTDQGGNLAFGANLKLGQLANNGGPTQTIAPLAGSPALNAGSNPAGLMTDQRGMEFVRTFGGTPDIGAFEVQNAFVITTTANSGTGSLRNVMAAANVNPGADTVTFDAALFSAPQTITLLTGQVDITDAVTITGPGAKLATVSGNKTNRVFNIDAPGMGTAIAISNLTITGGLATNGAGILMQDDAVTISDSAIVANTANSSDGGGIHVAKAGTLTVLGSTIANNSAVWGGGIDFFDQGGTLSFRNSTLSGNTAANGGGGIYFSGSSGSGVDIRNSTITANSSSNGGGISRTNVGSTVLSITSSIVSANVANTAPDISNPNTTNVNFSAIGSNNGFTLTGANNLAFGVNLKLASLANNGGPTQTHALLSGSPARDTGSNPAPALTFDQRGSGFPRVSGSAADIGAFELQGTLAPVVSGIVVNDGNVQRSRLTKVVVNFTTAVDLAQFSVAGATFFTRIGVANNSIEPIGTVVNTTNGLIISPTTGTGTSITLNFDNIDNAGLDFGSLSDGHWSLTITPASYVANAGNTGNQLRRFFGDVDNNGTVDASDFSNFPPFGTFVGSPFDFNNNNDIDSATDFANFGNRFGYTL